MVKVDAVTKRTQETLNDIVGFTVALQEVVESTSYGQPALKRRDRLIFALRKDLETLALVCGFEERAELMRAYPDAFFITDHYLNYPSVVVRLASVTKPVLRAAVKAAWERLGSLPSKTGKPLSARPTRPRR
jgi:hypothetical protein